MESLKTKIEGTDRKILIPVVAIIFLILISLIFYSVEKNSDNIHRGVKVEGISVSNLNKDQAQDLVKTETDKKIKEHIISFVNDETEYKYSLHDFGYTLDLNTAIDNAYEVGRSKSGVKNFFQIILSPIFTKNIEASGDINRDSLNKVLFDLNEKTYIKPVDAKLEVNPDGTVTIAKERIGQYLDNEEFTKLIEEDFINKEKIALPIYKTEPNIKSDFYAGIDKLYTEFETNYSSSPKGRKENIRIASSKFNNLKIKPGEEISFNNVVGDITSDNGFKTATVIVGGKSDTGIGGGVCQVSTTLYNSLVMSDLEITERHNHSRPIGYVDLGTDAAVVSDYKDLKFKNNTNNPILIKSEANGDTLSFSVFGNSKDRDYTVKMVPQLVDVVSPETITRYSDNIADGEEVVKESGAKGYSYITYKEKIKDGKVISKEKLSNSYYIPKDRVVVIGTGQISDEDSNEETN